MVIGVFSTPEFAMGVITTPEKMKFLTNFFYTVLLINVFIRKETHSIKSFLLEV